MPDYAPTFDLGTADPLTVTRLGFGAMRITGEGVWGPPRDRAEALRVLRRAVDLGIDFIDTADSYGPFVSEELIAEALHPYPEGLVIATKAGLMRDGPNKWRPNARPEHLVERCKSSLKRLRVERIDLFQLHRFDSKVPAGEFLGQLAELQQQGYVRHLGLSEVSTEQIEQAQQHFEVVSVQNKYNLGERQWEGELRWCGERGIGFIPWYPLSAGSLEHEGLRRVAERHGRSPYQIALAWLLHHADNLLPIPGTSSVAHLEENWASREIELGEEDLATLGALAEDAS